MQQAKKTAAGCLPRDRRQGSMTAIHREERSWPAPNESLARAKKADVRRSAGAPVAGEGRAREGQTPAQVRGQPSRPGAFKADGLRTYAHYRDLGVKDATRGMALAHVIRFVGQCDPKVVSKKHTHECEFQMIYVLKGMITTEIEGHGVHTMNAGDCWLQPQSIVHKVLGLFRRLRGAGDRAAGGLQDGRAGKVGSRAGYRPGRQDPDRGGDHCARPRD